LNGNSTLPFNLKADAEELEDLGFTEQETQDFLKEFESLGESDAEEQEVGV
jgi:hypothetical protein